MGMFDESYVNLPPMEQASGFGDTNAFMIGAQSGTQGMFQGLGKLMGFQDEEDLLMEIYNSSDLTTPQGRKEAIDRVRQVNPEAAEKLQQQILNGAEAEAAIQNTEMNVETTKLERAALLFGPAIKRKFETDHVFKPGFLKEMEYFIDNFVYRKNISLKHIDQLEQVTAFCDKLKRRKVYG